MKKVLFITQTYPPARSANVLCDDMIIRRLLATREAEIHCLCMRRHHGQALEEEIGGVYVHRFAMSRYLEFINGALDRPDKAAYKFVRVFDRIALRFNQIVTIPIYPCLYPIRTRKFTREAERLQREYGFDVVACEHYGYETMMAGFNLKKSHPEVRYLQFFWDALSGGTRPGYLSKAFIDRRRETLEKKVLETADCAVAMTSHEGHIMNMPYAGKLAASGRLCFRGVPYLQEIPPVGRENVLEFDNSKTNIVFAGNLWGRNLDYVLSVFSEVHGVDAVLWVLTSSGAEKLREKYSEYGDVVRFVPYVAHEKLLGVLSSADALLNMGVKNPNAISGKIFEYMGCCKPIISTYAIDNEACLPILGKYPISLLLDERDGDLVAAARKLEAFLIDSRSKQVDYASVEAVFYNCTPDSYCDLFDLPLKEGDARG